MLYPISMKLSVGHLWLNFKGVGGGGINDVISHVVRQPYFLNLQKPSKIPSETAGQIKGNLYKYNRLSMRNKKFATYDIIGHMVLQPYWIYPKTSKNHLLQNSLTDRGETSNTCFPRFEDTMVFMETINRSLGLAAILD